jgi:hypothetical protein
MCSLMLQIMETRLLSVIAWYYLAFFAISMAMFGMTAGSLFVYFKASLFPPTRLFEHLSWIGSAFAIAVVISTLSMISTVVLAGLTSAMMAVLWFKLIVIILPPYVLAGMAISLALTQSPWPVGIVYGVDLVGAEHRHADGKECEVIPRNHRQKPCLHDLQHQAAHADQKQTGQKQQHCSAHGRSRSHSALFR